MSSTDTTLNNRYRLDKLIGEGGFAHVYLATDLELGRQVAIKVLDQNWVRDKDLLTRFRNEARAVAALEHPNILLIYDYGVARGAPFIVMPYVSGGTLTSRMREGPLALDVVRLYLEQIGSALDYAHQRGIVHRDVKPSNLLIRPDGQLALMDFGLAKILDNADFAVQSVILGTVAYLSPEQSQGIVTPASDIYMLGVILYQMLTGKLPYEGDTTRILQAHLNEAPRSLRDQPTMRSMNPAVVQELDKVVLKVLAKVPAERYQTCQALSFAFNQALKADPNRAATPGNREQKLDARSLDKTEISTGPLPTPSATGGNPAGGAINLAPTTHSPERSGRKVNIKSIEDMPTGPVPDLDITEVEPRKKSPKSTSAQKSLATSNESTIIEPRQSPAPVKRPLKPPRLSVTTEPDKGFHAEFDLVGDSLTFGRAKDNMLFVPLAIISRHHAVITRLANESPVPTYKIAECKSINPLRFQGKRIAEKVLEDGDIIEIGDRNFADYIVKLTYHAARTS